MHLITEDPMLAATGTTIQTMVTVTARVVGEATSSATSTLEQVVTQDMSWFENVWTAITAFIGALF